MCTGRAYAFIHSNIQSRFFGILFILLLTSTGQAQDFEELADQPWMAEVPCKNNPERRSIVALEGHSFIVCYKFDEKELTPSARFVTLTVASYSPRGNPMLEIDSFAVADPGRQPGVTVSGQSGPHHHHKQLTSQRSYRYVVSLDNNLKPEPYQIKLRVSLNARLENLFFYLPMGAAGGDWLELTKESQKSIECWSGRICGSANLIFFNKLPYNLEITQVSVFSDPSDLLVGTASMDSQKLKKGLSPQPISITTEAKPISLFRALSGLRIPRAHLNLTYQDQYGREYLKQVPMELEVRPNIMLLAVMLLLGAVAGTIVRIDLGRLHKAGVITRKQQMVFAATTFASGVLVCLIALFANLKLVVFADQNTYSAWDPKMLFLTSLIGTIGGIPILYALLKLPPANDGRPHQIPSGSPPQVGLARRTDHEQV